MERRVSRVQKNHVFRFTLIHETLMTEKSDLTQRSPLTSLAGCTHVHRVLVIFSLHLS